MLYTNLLFQAPLLVLTIILHAIALEGATWLLYTCVILSYAIQLYSAVFQVFALRAVQELSQGRAIACVVLLVLLFSFPPSSFLPSA